MWRILTLRGSDTRTLASMETSCCDTEEKFPTPAKIRVPPRRETDSDEEEEKEEDDREDEDEDEEVEEEEDSGSLSH